MTTGLLLTTLGLGLRHGFDWDHIAAIADLSSTAESRRRGMMLSFLYAIGHAVVVVLLGTAAIVFGASLPPGVDVWMGRLVGATLVALGAWVLIELVRKGRDFRLRSRWILVLGGTFAGLRRVREATARRRLEIEHEHEHEHADDHAGDGHDHGHDHDPDRNVEKVVAEAEPVVVGRSRPASDQGPAGPSGGHWHSHRHGHQTSLVESATGTGNGTAAGIGLLHGVGFESPTQIAVFVASTSVVGVGAGFALLLAWVIGLVVANSLLAGLAAFGLLSVERNFVLYAAIATFVGVASLTLGAFMLLGVELALPTLA